MVMCVRRGVWARLSFLRGTPSASLLALVVLAWAPPGQAQLSEALTKWADNTVGLSTLKWGGPRVPFPRPTARPQGAVRLESPSWPLSVHADASVPRARVEQVLEAAEATFALLSAAGFLTSFGDAGQGGSAGRDVYVLDGYVGAQPAPGPAHEAELSQLPSARAEVDASDNFSALDGTRSFVLLDARVPRERVFACTAQGLIEAQLVELDPAESVGVRRSSAAYFASLLTGELCDDGQGSPQSYPFADGQTALGAAWLEQLSARQDGNRGTFLFDMWQFARQRTWEGHELRASPDLLEAIDSALDVQRESFVLVSAELAEDLARRTQRAVREVSWSALPAFTPKSDPPLAPLACKQLRVELGQPRPGARLRVWSRGEAGGRYVLSASRLAESGSVLARLELEPRRDPTSQLHVELDAQTTAVLISVTRVGDNGLVDPDTVGADDLRTVAITVDAQQ